jgi:hypothetical protein
MQAGPARRQSDRSLIKPGTYGDGDGLYLQVRGPDQRSWLYRFKLHSRPHLMGLGTVRDVSLAEARDAAATASRAPANSLQCLAVISRDVRRSSHDDA